MVDDEVGLVPLRSPPRPFRQHPGCEHQAPERRAISEAVGQSLDLRNEREVGVDDLDVVPGEGQPSTLHVASDDNDGAAPSGERGGHGGTDTRGAADDDGRERDIRVSHFVTIWGV